MHHRHLELLADTEGIARSVAAQIFAPEPGEIYLLREHVHRHVALLENGLDAIHVIEVAVRA